MGATRHHFGTTRTTLGHHLVHLSDKLGLLGCNLVSTLSPLGDYLMITSGEYFCPVGCIWPFFSFAFNQVKTSTFYPPQHSTELFMALVINAGRLCEVFSFLLASFDFQTTARLRSSKSSTTDIVKECHLSIIRRL